MVTQGREIPGKSVEVETSWRMALVPLPLGNMRCYFCGFKVASYAITAYEDFD